MIHWFLVCQPYTKDEFDVTHQLFNIVIILNLIFIGDNEQKLIIVMSHGALTLSLLRGSPLTSQIIWR